MSLLARTNTKGTPLGDFFGSNMLDDFFDEGWPGRGFGGIMPFRNFMPETSSMLTTPTFPRAAVYALSLHTPSHLPRERTTSDRPDSPLALLVDVNASTM
jgi:hypothetical protein